MADEIEKYISIHSGETIDEAIRTIPILEQKIDKKSEVQQSDVNGKILVNGEELEVYDETQIINSLNEKALSDEVLKRDINNDIIPKGFRINTYGNLSASNQSGSTLVGNNMYLQNTPAAFKYLNTHPSLGAAGVYVRAAQKQLQFLYKSGATVADEEFTPEIYNIWHTDNLIINNVNAVLLNQWVVAYSVAEYIPKINRTGNRVNISGAIQGGLIGQGTTLFYLPLWATPIGNRFLNVGNVLNGSTGTVLIRQSTSSVEISQPFTTGSPYIIDISFSIS